MKKIIPLFILVAFMLGILTGVGLWKYHYTPAREMNWSRAIHRVMRTVVTLTGARADDTTTTTRTGTGIIVSGNGFVITSKHLLGEGLGYTVTLSDNISYPARVIKEHPTKDLALLQIISDTKHSFPIGTFGNSHTRINIGDNVITIGTTLGLYPGSVVEGVISGLDRTVSFGDISANGLIQTSIAASLGHSGGPLIQADGTIIGIIMGIVGGSSQIGWAIPVTQSEIMDFIRS